MSKNAFLVFCTIFAAIFSSCAVKHPIQETQTSSRNEGGALSIAKLDPIITTESFAVGYSVQHRPINVTRIGSGRKLALVVIACIHGEEGNTYVLAKLLLEKYKTNLALIPKAVTFYFVPLVNPDGYASQRRENACGVDLNRNFPTIDWRSEALDMHSVMVEGLGGESPASELEVKALVTFLTETVRPNYESVCVVALHSASPPIGYIQPAYTENGVPEKLSLSFADAASKTSGYNLLPGWVEKHPITGELIRFCTEIGIAGMDVELPTYDPPDSIPKGKKESTLDSCVKLIDELISQGSK